MERWVRRALETKADSNTKYLFANVNGKKDTRAVYEPYFFAKLKAIQREERGYIPKSVEVEDVFGMS